MALLWSASGIMLLSCLKLFNYAVSALKCFRGMYNKSCSYTFLHVPDFIMSLDYMTAMFWLIIDSRNPEWVWIRADVILFNDRVDIQYAACIIQHSVVFSCWFLLRIKIFTVTRHFFWKNEIFWKIQYYCYSMQMILILWNLLVYF